MWDYDTLLPDWGAILSQFDMKDKSKAGIILVSVDLYM